MIFHQFFVRLFSFIVYSTMLPIVVIGQVSEAQIKLGQTYYWGEAVGENLIETRSFARQDLANRIVTIVNSNSRMYISDQDGVSSQSYSLNVYSESNLRFTELNYLEERRRGNTHRVIAYINAEEFRNQISMLENNLKTSIRNSNNLEEQYGLDYAIPEYLLTWKESRYIPHNIFIPVNSDSIELNRYIRQKIRQWGDMIDVSIEGTSGGLVDNKTVNILTQLHLSTENKPLNNAEVRWSELGYGYHKSNGGSVSLYYDKLPSKLKSQKKILIRPSNTATTDLTHEELSQFEIEKNVVIDYSKIVNLSMSIVNDNPTTVELKAEIENISVSHIEWFIGNTPSGTTQLVSIPKSRLLNEPIILKINRDQDISISNYFRGNQLLDKSTNELQENSKTSQNLTQQNKIVEFSSPVVPLFELNNTIINELLQIHELNLLRNWLLSQKRVGNLDFGTVNEGDDVKNYPNAYIAIVNPVSGIVIDFFSKEIDGEREIYNMKKRTIDPSVEFQGQRVGPIWIKIN